MVLRGAVTLALVDQHFPARFHAWGLRRGLGESLHAGPLVARRPATCVADSRVLFLLSDHPAPGSGTVQARPGPWLVGSLAGAPGLRLHGLDASYSMWI